MLRELVRFLEDDASGVSSGMRMSASWRDVCDAVHKGSPLKKSDPSVVDAVSDWHELVRYLSIRLSVSLGESCSVWLPRKHATDPALRLSDDVGALVSSQELSNTIDVPKAAGRVDIKVSLTRKTLDLKVNVETPKDVKQQRAAINFVLSQYKALEDSDLQFRVNWPRRVQSTELSLNDALDEELRKTLIPENFRELPNSVDLIRVVDLGGKLKTGNGLPEIAEMEITKFYREAVQGLQKWIPKAPKVRTPKAKTEDSQPSSTDSLVSYLDKENIKSFASYISALPRPEDP